MVMENHFILLQEITHIYIIGDGWVNDTYEGKEYNSVTGQYIDIYTPAVQFPEEVISKVMPHFGILQPFVTVSGYMKRYTAVNNENKGGN